MIKMTAMPFSDGYAPVKKYERWGLIDTLGHTVLPTVYDQTRELSAYSEKEQEAIALWSDTKEAKYTMPSVTLTTEENEELYKLLADIETYASENVIRFIIGDLDLSEWDSFTATMRDMGIERCIEIYQGALDAA